MIADEVYRAVGRQLQKLSNLPEQPRKAMLTNLRRGVGRIPGDVPELWGMLLQDLPEEVQSKDGTPTPGEWAIYLALTLYAIHQQGQSMNTNQPDVSLGNAVRRLAEPGQEPEKSPSFRRFKTLLTASDIRETAHHLRGMIQLLRDKAVPLDYPRLAKDLYFLQFTSTAPQVRLRWGQDYYHNTKTEDEKAVDELKEEQSDG